jgi:hypothetical protein
VAADPPAVGRLACTMASVRAAGSPASARDRRRASSAPSGRC